MTRCDPTWQVQAKAEALRSEEEAKEAKERKAGLEEEVRRAQAEARVSEERCAETDARMVSLSHTHSHSHTLSLTHFLTQTHSLTHSPTHTHSLTHQVTLLLSHTPTHALTRILSLTHSLTHSLTLALALRRPWRTLPSRSSRLPRQPAIPRWKSSRRPWSRCEALVSGFGWGGGRVTSPSTLRCLLTVDLSSHPGCRTKAADAHRALGTPSAVPTAMVTGGLVPTAMLTRGLEQDTTRIAQLEEEAREATEKVAFSFAHLI